MSKTLAQIHKEKVKEHGTQNNKHTDLPVGTKVLVITPCCDFRFFYEPTGVVTKSEDKYLGISVEFDKPMKYKDGTTLMGFNFHPVDLAILETSTKKLCPYCHQAPKGGE